MEKTTEQGRARVQQLSKDVEMSVRQWLSMTKEEREGSEKKRQKAPKMVLIVAGPPTYSMLPSWHG